MTSQHCLVYFWRQTKHQNLTSLNCLCYILLIIHKRRAFSAFQSLYSFIRMSDKLMGDTLMPLAHFQGILSNALSRSRLGHFWFKVSVLSSCSGALAERREKLRNCVSWWKATWFELLHYFHVLFVCDKSLERDRTMVFVWPVAKSWSARWPRVREGCV